LRGNSPARRVPQAEEGMATAIDCRLGLRLRDIRERRGLGQAELAARLDVRVAAVRDWEDGRDALNLWQIVQLADALDVAPANMLEMPGKRLRRAISTAAQLTGGQWRADLRGRPYHTARLNRIGYE
jgi:DNA-binding transcriptional regulator YiaG